MGFTNAWFSMFLYNVIRIFLSDEAYCFLFIVNADVQCSLCVHVGPPFERLSSPQSMNGIHVFCPVPYFLLLLYLFFCPHFHTPLPRAKAVLISATAGKQG